MYKSLINLNIIEWDGEEIYFMGIREPTILIRIRRSLSLWHFSSSYLYSIPLKLQTSKIIYSYNGISSNSFSTRLSPIPIDPVKFMIDFSRNKNHVNDTDQSFAKKCNSKYSVLLKAYVYKTC